MQIVVNGKPVQTKAQNLQELCSELGFGTAKIATALNGDFIARPARGDTMLGAGDKIEIVAPRSGG